MKRDFSSASRQKLLDLVDDVEREKFSDITDWIGDAYYTFQTWIGRLNINNYINNVEAYHKKVIDKNNASKEKIEGIFYNIASIDSSYGSKINSVKTILQKWDRYIVQMNDIISPNNGNFSAEFITDSLDGILKQYSISELSLRLNLYVEFDNSTGEYIYDWKEIDNLLAKGAENLSTEEYSMILTLLLTMKDMAGNLNDKVYNKLKQYNLITQALNVILEDIFYSGGGFRDSVNISDIRSNLLNIYASIFSKSGLVGIVEPIAALIISKETKSDNETSPLEKIADIISLVNKKVENNKADGVSALLKYVDSLIGLFTKKYDNGTDAAIGWLSQGKNSIDVEAKLYKYLEGILPPSEAWKFYNKYGNIISGLSITKEGFGVGSELLKLRQVIADNESDGFDIGAQGIGVFGELFNLGGAIYIAKECNTKVLKPINQILNIPKPVNQILSIPSKSNKLKPINSFVITDESSKRFVLTESSKEKLGKAGTYLAVGGVVFASLEGGVRQIGESLEDGFQTKDIGEIGIATSVSGITEVVSSLTLGLISVDAEKATDYVLDKVKNKNADNNIFIKKLQEEMQGNDNKLVEAGWTALASLSVAGEFVADGAKKVAENVVGVVDTINDVSTVVVDAAINTAYNIGNSVVEGTKAVAGWISDGWNSIWGK